MIRRVQKRFFRIAMLALTAAMLLVTAAANLANWINVRAELGETLDASIRQMQSAYALLDALEWTSVLDSIFYDSLYGIGGAVLKGVYRKPKRLGRGRTTKGDTV